MYGYSKAVRMVAAVMLCLLGLLGATETFAQEQPTVTGRIEWGIWLDRDGCQHWYSDGGLEGYMVERVRPKDGKPVCVKVNTCLVENTDTMFATDSAHLTASGAARLRSFFQGAGAYGYAVYGHTDSRASDEYNISLSNRRAAAVA